MSFPQSHIRDARNPGLVPRSPLTGLGHCVTCGDDGTPMTVLKLRGDQGLCEDAGGAHHTVELALVHAGVGDRVLVHAGVALVTL
jgi:hydrogenase expression/formation protein HypC